MFYLQSKNGYRNESEAEEIVHDTCVRCIEKMDQFDGKHFLAWARTILERIYIDKGVLKANDDLVIHHACEEILKNKSDSFIFSYIGGIDKTGHKYGFSLQKDEYIKYLKYKNKPKKSILKKQQVYKPKNTVDQYTHEYHYSDCNNQNKMNDYIYFNNRPQFNPNGNGVINSIDTRNDDRFNNNISQALEQQKLERGMDIPVPQGYDNNPYGYQIPFEQTSLNGATNTIQRPIESSNQIQKMLLSVAQNFNETHLPLRVIYDVVTNSCVSAVCTSCNHF